MLDDTSNVSIRVIVAMALLVGAAILIGGLVVQMANGSADGLTNFAGALKGWLDGITAGGLL